MFYRLSELIVSRIWLPWWFFDGLGYETTARRDQDMQLECCYLDFWLPLVRYNWPIWSQPVCFQSAAGFSKWECQRTSQAVTWRYQGWQIDIDFYFSFVYAGWRGPWWLVPSFRTEEKSRHICIGIIFKNQETSFRLCCRQGHNLYRSKAQIKLNTGT